MTNGIKTYENSYWSSSLPIRRNCIPGNWTLFPGFCQSSNLQLWQKTWVSGHIKPISSKPSRAYSTNFGVAPTSLSLSGWKLSVSGHPRTATVLFPSAKSSLCFGTVWGSSQFQHFWIRSPAHTPFFPGLYRTDLFGNSLWFDPSANERSLSFQPWQPELVFGIHSLPGASKYSSGYFWSNSQGSLGATSPARRSSRQYLFRCGSWQILCRNYSGRPPNESSEKILHFQTIHSLYRRIWCSKEYGRTDQSLCEVAITVASESSAGHSLLNTGRCCSRNQALVPRSRYSGNKRCDFHGICSWRRLAAALQFNGSFCVSFAVWRIRSAYCRSDPLWSSCYRFRLFQHYWNSGSSRPAFQPLQHRFNHGKNLPGSFR